MNVMDLRFECGVCGQSFPYRDGFCFISDLDLAHKYKWEENKELNVNRGASWGMTRPKMMCTNCGEKKMPRKTTKLVNKNSMDFK